MFTWTEAPITEIWRQLRYLTAPSNVIRLLSGKVPCGRDPKWQPNESLEVRASAISACIRQADQYFRAAESVELSIRPLLQFYCAESLAKAAILSSNEDISINNLNYHGLNTRPPQTNEELNTYRNDPGRWRVEKEFAVTAKGVFRELCVALGGPRPEEGSSFYFRDIFKVTPDLAPLYARHYGEASWCYSLREEPSADEKGHITISLHEVTPHDRAVAGLPGIGDDFESLASEPSITLRSKSPMNELPAYLRVIDGTVGGPHLVRCLDDSLVHSASTLFVGLFIASNLVRYKPRFWMTEIESNGTGAVAIVEAFCNVARRRFPNDILDSIWRERFEYGTPGRLV